MRLIHIINPVKVGPSSDLFVAQPVTFESLKLAKQRTNNLEVIQLTTQFPEDRSIIPGHLDKTKDLRRSVANLRSKELTRKLPYINDIIKRAYKKSEPGDYIIYSNVDIGVKPEFYNWIHNTIQKGTDAFVINRRTISDRFTSPAQLQEMFQEEGVRHPGYDCFVFRREIYKKMVLEKVCVGAVFIGLAIYLNMNLLSMNFEEFGDEHLTFHIGNDQVWRTSDNNPYAEHNKREFEKVKRKLAKRYDNVNQIIADAFPTLRD